MKSSCQSNLVLNVWFCPSGCEPALTFIIIYTTTFPDGYGHPCHDQVLQPARHVLRHLRLQQIPLWLQVPLVPSQHLLWPQEEPRLCVKGGRSEHFYTFFFLNIPFSSILCSHISCLRLLSLWDRCRHLVQHSLDSRVQALHEQPEGSMLLSGWGKRWTLKQFLHLKEQHQVWQPAFRWSSEWQLFDRNSCVNISVIYCRVCCRFCPCTLCFTLH